MWRRENYPTTWSRARKRPTRAHRWSSPIQRETPLHIALVTAGGQVRVTLAARKGTITLSRTDGLTFLVGTGESNIAMTFTGAIADVNAALEGLQFLPTDGYSGPALLRLTTLAIGYGGQGGPPQADSAVQIKVRPLPVQPLEMAPPQVTVTPPPAPISLTGGQGQPIITIAPVAPGDINGEPLYHRPHGGGAGDREGASGGDGGGANPTAPTAPAPPPGSHGDPPPANKRPDPPLPRRTMPPRHVPAVVAALPPAVPPAKSDFWRQLDQVGQDLDSQHHSTQLTVGSTSAVTALMSIGYVIWAVRAHRWRQASWQLSRCGAGWTRCPCWNPGSPGRRKPATTRKTMQTKNGFGPLPMSWNEGE